MVFYCFFFFRYPKTETRRAGCLMTFCMISMRSYLMPYPLLQLKRVSNVERCCLCSRLLMKNISDEFFWFCKYINTFLGEGAILSARVADKQQKTSIQHARFRSLLEPDSKTVSRSGLPQVPRWRPPLEHFPRINPSLHHHWSQSFLAVFPEESLVSTRSCANKPVMEAI